MTTEPKPEHLNHRGELASIFYLTGFISLVAFGFVDTWLGETLCMNLLPMLVGVFAFGFYLQLRFTSDLFIVASTTAMVMLHFFWLITGDLDGAGPFWTMVLLPPFFHFLGHRVGSIISIGMLVVGIILVLTPLGPYIPAQYDKNYIMRYFCAYGIMIMMCYMMEYVQYQVRNNLHIAREVASLKSKTDALTGLANRYGFNDYVGFHEKRSSPEAGLFGVIVCDLDNFKLVNDQYGHEVGDELLVEISDNLRSMVRSEDLVSRWGGEEFLILMLDADRQGVMVLAEKIRRKIEQSTMELGSAELHVTLSLGIQVQSVNQPLSETMKEADQAMYEAKNTGKNRVVAAWHVLGS